MKEKILISACLLGTPCRYDGRSKPSEKLNSLNDLYELIPVCPEVLGGLSTPRLPCEIQNGRVIRSDGKDMTEFYKRGAEIALEIAKKHNCTIAILKENIETGSKKLFDCTYKYKGLIGSVKKLLKRRV